MRIIERGFQFFNIVGGYNYVLIWCLYDTLVCPKIKVLSPNHFPKNSY